MDYLYFPQINLFDFVFVFLLEYLFIFTLILSCFGMVQQFSKNKF